MKSLFVVFLTIFFAPTIVLSQTKTCYTIQDLLSPFVDSTNKRSTIDFISAQTITTNLMTYTNSIYFTDSNQQYNKFQHYFRDGILLMLRPCNHFIFHFKKSNLSFRGYELIEFTIPDMREAYYIQTDDTCIRRFNISYQGQRPYENPSSSYGKKDITTMHLMEKGLIINLSTTIFVSGYMYLDNIADEFFYNDKADSSYNPLSRVNKESLEQYIKIRYYNYEPKDIIIHNYEATFFSPVTNTTHSCRLKTKLVTTYWGKQKLSIMEDFQ